MSDAASFPYVPRDPMLGSASLAPMLPLRLSATQGVSVVGLVDSGATVNVLPFSLGVQLGFDWDEPRPLVSLSGLASVEARVVTVEAQVGEFEPVRMYLA